MANTKPAKVTKGAKPKATKGKAANLLAESEKKYGQQGKQAIKEMEKDKPKPAVYKGKSTRPGGGESFAMKVDAMVREGKSKESAEAIAASMGRKKYGAKQMAKWSAQGRKRARK